MKIFIVASYADSIYRFRGPLIQAMIDRGWDVVVAAPGLDGAGEFGRFFESKGIRIYSIPLQRTGTNPLRDMASLLCLYRILVREKPDVLFAYTVKPVVYGVLAAVLAGVKRRYALITGLGYAFTDDRKGVVPNIVKFLYRLSFSFSTKVFFQNPDDEALFRNIDLLPVNIPSVVVDGSGIDISQFQVAPLPDKHHFLLIARLLGDKGIREYVAAAKIVKVLHPESVFSLVGWIDENPDAIPQDELDNWIAQGDIEYLGKLADVRPAIQSASVYVLPSYREGTPRTVLEAMAMGRPIITTDAPGCRETVLDGVNGYLVPVKSVDGLVNAMLRFIDRPESVQIMGGKSRSIAEVRYDVNKVNEKMLNEMGI